MKKVDCTPSWGFVTQVILATLDANTNIKPKDRENIKGQLVDMSRVADAHVELMTKGELIDGEVTCDKCGGRGDYVGGTIREGNLALLGRTDDPEVDGGFGDFGTLCNSCMEKGESVW